MSYSIASTPHSIQRNKLLSNTYALLALSMIPTILASSLAMWSGAYSIIIAHPFIMSLLMMFGLMYLAREIQKNRYSAKGIWLMFAVSAVMGFFISGTLAAAIGRAGINAVLISAAMTGTVFFVMAQLARVIKRDLTGFGNMLTVGAVLLLVMSLVNLFFHISALAMTIAVIGSLIFSGFILFDLKRIVDGGEDSYISATLNLYLSVINLFTIPLSFIGSGE